MKQLKTFATALLAALAFTFAACSNDDVEEPVGPDAVSEILVLNNGNWGANDANILGYDVVTQTASPNLFAKINGRQLGDLGQDIAAAGADLYIAVNGSQVVFVTDRALTIKHEVVAEADGVRLSPRSLSVAGDKVYVTYYEGYLGEINTADYSVRTTSVGLNPEGLAVANGKIYVANSGGLNYENGYDNTISVVDAKSFREERRLEVNTNPQNVVVSPDAQTLYVNSYGNYADVPALLQSINIATGEVSTFDYADVKHICAGPGDVLYVATGAYDENWQVTGMINVFNMQTQKAEGTLFDTPVSNYYSLSYSGGYVFVGASDYQTNGDVYIYGVNGHLVAKLDAQGLNPQKCIRLYDSMVY